MVQMKLSITWLQLMLVVVAACSSSSIKRPVFPDSERDVTLFRDISQVAVITENADATIELLRNTLDIGAFKVWQYGEPSLFRTTYGGKPEAWTMKLAISWIGDMQIEVIQPTRGKNLYRDYLNSYKNPGVQHILLERDRIQYKCADARLATMGFPIHQDGILNAKARLGFMPLPTMPRFLAKRYATHFGYTDTQRSLNVSIEIAKFPFGMSSRTALGLARADYWSGEDPSTFDTLPPNSLISDISRVYILTDDVDGTMANYQRLTSGSLAPETVAIKDHTTAETIVIRRGRVRFRTTELVIVQPVSRRGIFHELLVQRGEGAQIIGGTTRFGSRTQLIRAFRTKGLHPVLVTESGQYEFLYFRKEGFPFALEIALRTKPRAN